MDNFIWGVGADYSSAGTSTRVDKTARKNDSEIMRLRTQVDRLTIACQSMWELIRDHTELDDDRLAGKIAEVDLRDGSPDGKLGSTVVKCTGCGKNNNSARNNCLWCGIPVEREHMFEG